MTSGADGAQFGHALVTLAAADDEQALCAIFEKADPLLVGYAAAYLAHTVADAYRTAARERGVELDQHLADVGAELAAISEQYRP